MNIQQLENDFANVVFDLNPYCFNTETQLFIASFIHVKPYDIVIW